MKEGCVNSRWESGAFVVLEYSGDGWKNIPHSCLYDNSNGFVIALQA